MEFAKTYNVGIIGFGFIGKVHAFGYRTLPFYSAPMPLTAKITRIVTGHADTAEEARRLMEVESASTDYRDITQCPEIDIVHICTPNRLHKDALLSAMKHGKHIYCDKPMVADWREVPEIEAALEEYHGTSQMTFQNRFFPATLCAKQMVDRGVLGEVLGFRAAYLHAGSADPNAALKWKLSSTAGGGVIADLASHVLDFIEHLAGPIGSLMAATRVAYLTRPSLEDPTVRLPVDAEDCVSMLVQLESGAVGTIEATKIATGSEDELRCEIEGSTGALRFNLMDPHHLEFFDASPDSRPADNVRGWVRMNTGQRYEPPGTTFPSPKAAIGWIRGHVACLANFLQAVADGRPGDPDLRHGIRVERLMEATRRSASRRRWVNVADV